MLRNIRAVVPSALGTPAWLIVLCAGFLLSNARAAEVVIVEMSATAIAADPQSGALFAALTHAEPGAFAVLPEATSRLVRINSRTHQIEAATTVPKVNQLAFAGGTVFAASIGDESIHQFDAASLHSMSTIALGTSPRFGQPRTVRALAAIDAKPDGASTKTGVGTGIVARGFASDSGSDGIALYGAEGPHPVSTRFFENATSLAVTTDRQVVGFDGTDSGFTLNVMRVDDAGLTVMRSATGLLVGFDTEIAAAGRNIVATTGQLIDPITLTQLGTFAAEGPVAADAENGVVAFAQTDADGVTHLASFREADFSLVSSLTLGGIAGPIDAIVNTGTESFALATADGQLVFVEPAPVPLPAPVALLGASTGFLLYLRRRRVRLAR